MNKPYLAARRDTHDGAWAKDCQDGNFIERVRYVRKQLFDCIGLPGFNEQKIREALRDYTNGHLESWLWTEAERQRLQQDTMYTWLSPAGIIDALHYWGSVPGWKLMDWGIENLEKLDPEEEYEVEAILVGPYVIYCSLNADPLHRRPYWKACYDAVPGSFWGRSVPDLAETCQKMCNASASALADNLGMASGPVIWVHNDRLADGENATDIYPWRVYQLKSDATQGVEPRHRLDPVQPADRGGTPLPHINLSARSHPAPPKGDIFLKVALTTGTGW